MPGLLAGLPVLFAQGPAAGPTPAQTIANILPFIVVGLLWFYFIMILPQRKQDKQRRSMLDALKKNDKVLTSAGIYGTVMSVDDKEDRVTLRIDDDKGVKVAFSRASIVRVVDGGKEDKDKTSKEKAAQTT